MLFGVCFLKIKKIKLLTLENRSIIDKICIFYTNKAFL